MWKEIDVFLEKNKEILNAKLWTIALALKTAKTKTKNNYKALITVFIDSQEAITTISLLSPCISNYFWEI